LLDLAVQGITSLDQRQQQVLATALPVPVEA